MKTCARCHAQFPEDRLAACPRCLMNGELLGGVLELQEEIGTGGMGTVYRARHVRLGRTVAVKFLPEALAAQPEFQARFEREARALAMLNHPNIVTIHDVGEGYLVMEFVDGRPLSAMLPLEPARAVEITRRVCDALAYAHAKGVIHRDIKPANILVDAAGRVKVTDFGIARITTPGYTVTSADRAVGTPAYMSPEALTGAPPDPRMDVYSVGAMLYEMLVGRPPAGSFPPAPGGLDRVIRKALAPDPAQRYATIDALARDLSEPAPDFPPDEVTWLRVVAILQSISCAVAIWAFLECLKPKEMRREDVNLLIAAAVKDLGDGRVKTWARFEMWHMMGALATFAIAISGYGALRRHWRLSGLEIHEPDRPVPEANALLLCGVVALAIYGVRHYFKSLGYEWTVVYGPVIGGPVLVAVLFFFWVAVLQSWRRHRPLSREPRIWLGLTLALTPPTIEFAYQLRAWAA